MRVLYVASREPKTKTLLVEHEVTKLQRQLRDKAGDEIDLHFLPALPFQDIRNEVQRFKPDVLHISAHGKVGEIHFVDSNGQEVALTAKNVAAILGNYTRLHVLYLSACHSAPLAKQLSDRIPVTIGTTNDIENYFARETSVAFYEGLYAGSTIREAFETSRGVLETLTKDVSTDIFSQSKEAESKILHSSPQLLARFSKFDVADGKDFDIEPGFLGAPKNTNQIVFFTNDLDFATRKGTWEEKLCWITRDAGRGSTRWLHKDWSSSSDFRLFATAVTDNGEFRTVSAMISEALTAYYSQEAAHRGRTISSKLTRLIERLVDG